MKLDEKIMRRLLQTFNIEAGEHIQLISNQLLKYENESDTEKKSGLIEEIFRAAHSLKGAARAVGLNPIVEICQNIENLFSGLKKNELRESHQLFVSILNSVKIVSAYIEETDEEKRSSMISEIEKYTDILNTDYYSNLKNNENADKNVELRENISDSSSKRNSNINSENVPIKSIRPRKKTAKKLNSKSEAGTNKKHAGILSEKKTPQMEFEKKIKIADQIRVSLMKIENLLIQSEELLPNKQAVFAHQNDLASISLLFESWRKKWGKTRLHYNKLRNSDFSDQANNKRSEQLDDLLKFYEYNEEFVVDIEGLISDLERSVFNNYNDLSNKIYQLNHSVKSVLMLPFKSLTGQFPVMVHDIASQLGKNIEFSVSGDDLEIDKRVLDEMKDPFVHLIRNSIDHGIELPESRLGMNKPEIGKISLSIKSVSGNNVQIQIEDDGRGINIDSVKESALKKNIKSQKELDLLNDSEILNLIFESELSTSNLITDLSGRGLGMAIVKEKIENLSGSYSIESIPNEGTKITLNIPLSVAAVRGLVIKCGDIKFLIKTSNLVAAIRVNQKEITTVENSQTISYAGRHIGLVKLSDILGVKNFSTNSHYNVVLCKSGKEELGIIVDEVIDEEEILIKSFNRQIKKLKFYEAASVSADGQVIPIINIDSVFKSASNVDLTNNPIESISELSEKNILVVDDSITSRLLLKDILENSGYKVQTCVDGKEAWTRFRQEQYDLVVSDVEMPRMTGFGLTKLIKTSEKYSQIPVVLVTGLSKKEDIEKGIDAGADAYIIKNDFEQSNLLETVKRLI